jgi:hypothetical protein
MEECGYGTWIGGRINLRGRVGITFLIDRKTFRGIPFEPPIAKENQVYTLYIIYYASI